MKKLLLLILVSLCIISCSKEHIVNITYVENTEIQLNTQKLLAEVDEPFMKSSGERQTYSTDSQFDNSYEHIIPNTYTAYIVAGETKGQYTAGDLVDQIQVTEGTQTISIPQMEVQIYVTNYIRNNSDWYTWSDAFQQLPQTSETIYLLGNNIEDFSIENSITVTLENKYAAVMIKDNQWVRGAPKSYDTNDKYFLDNPTNWYILYIRNSDTNTEIPISIPGLSNHYDLMRPIESNKIYQFTLDGNILDGEGNLTVIVNPLIEGYTEVIDPFN